MALHCNNDLQKPKKKIKFKRFYNCSSENRRILPKQIWWMRREYLRSPTFRIAYDFVPVNFLLQLSFYLLYKNESNI